jgi:hypothetical protein
MQAAQSQPGGQFDISEGPKPVLRYNYAKAEPLVLRFRLWIHPGGQPAAAAGADQWLAANSRFSPLS